MLPLRPLKELWRSGPNQSSPCPSTLTGTGLWLWLSAANEHCFAIVRATRRLKTSLTTIPLTPPSGLLRTVQTTQSKNLQSCGRDMTSRQEGGDLTQQFRVSLGLKNKLQVFASHPGPGAAPRLALLKFTQKTSRSNSDGLGGTQSHQIRIKWLPQCGGSACRRAWCATDNSPIMANFSALAAFTSGW